MFLPASLYSCLQNFFSHRSLIALISCLIGASVGLAGEINKVTLESGSFLEKVKADLYFGNFEEAPTSAIVLNPGAYIPAAEMGSMAKEFAQRNSLVYVIHNTLDLAILPTNQRKSIRLLTALSKNPEKIKGIPSAIAQSHKDGIKTVLIGHSMGGAVLNQFADNLQPDLLDGLVYLGVSKLVGEPKTPGVPVAFIYGELDGLIEKPAIGELAAKISAEKIELKEVNHFCFIENTSVVSAEYRNRDQESPLNSAGCNMRLWKSLKDADWI